MRKAICSVSCHELTMVFPSARDFEKTYLTRALKQPLPRYHPPGSAHHLRPARVPRGMGDPRGRGDQAGVASRDLAGGLGAGRVWVESILGGTHAPITRLRRDPWVTADTSRAVAAMPIL